MVGLLPLLLAGAASSNQTHPVDFPPNYNTTLYMYAEQHGSTISHVQYSYATRQALYTTLWAEHAKSSDCSLLFEDDGSVWEWYAGERACAKLMEGVGLFPPSMARRAGMTVPVTPPDHPLVSVNPFTHEAAPPCNLFCAPDDGPCYCESLEPPFQPILHTHADRNLSGSRSYYAPFVLAAANGTALGKPAYCPPPATPPKYEANMTGLECSCNRCWF